MISDNAIPHCGLELGLCSRQIPYNMLAHDKIVHKDGYQQGRADGIRDFAEWLKSSKYGIGEDGGDYYYNLRPNSYDWKPKCVTVDELLEEYAKSVK